MTKKELQSILRKENPPQWWCNHRYADLDMVKRQCKMCGASQS